MGTRQIEGWGLGRLKDGTWQIEWWEIGRFYGGGWGGAYPNVSHSKFTYVRKEKV